MTEAEVIYARRYITYVAQICAEVANGLDPIKGMYKVRAWEDMENSSPPEQPEKEGAVPEENKLQSLMGAIRNLLSTIGSLDEAEKYGMGAVFSESVKWVAFIQKVTSEAKAKAESISGGEPVAIEAIPKAKEKKSKKKK